MAAMFKVRFRTRSEPSSTFEAKTVIAKDASEAIKKAAQKARALIRAEEDLFVSDVELLGVES